MFRTLRKAFLPNPFDWMLKKTVRKGGRKILIAWNRGLGDIALGLYAMVQRIREIIPDAEITFVTRHNLYDGFSMLEGVKTIVAPDWKRGEPYKVDPSLKAEYDLVIERPSPTDWVSWQRGKVVPQLTWDPKHDNLYERFQMGAHFTWIGVQVAAETNYALWRNWPLARWQELFDRLEKLADIKVALFGFGEEPKFSHQNIVDLRGKTTLFELISIIKHRISSLILPDSGISSMAYYLKESFPLKLVSLWADPNHGILKQGVCSPNVQLKHFPLIATKRGLAEISVDQVLEKIFPVEKVGAILLAGGQGTRLGVRGPKGLFSIGGKTLFQWFCEKMPKDRPLAIMTSPLNHEETLNYFGENRCFGLDVHFFQQEMAPFLDDEKKPIEWKGPNGNGSVFRSFINAGLGEVFQKKGVDLVTVSYIENLFARPFDPLLIHRAREAGADATVQCIEWRETDRSMGVVLERGDRVEIAEYVALVPDQKYRYAYSGQIAFTLPFFCNMLEAQLPIHWVRKKVDNRWVWKGEKFVFDAFAFAKSVAIFEVPRETHYAPIKGPECIEPLKKRLREKR
jgi:ADP-heptose:LPS heptosyltransferase